MTDVELPAVPNIVTSEDVETARALKQQHERELRDFEEETRRQRHQLRKLKRTMAAGKPKAEEQQDVHQPSELQLAEEWAKKLALEGEVAKAAERDAEQERAEAAQNVAERALLEEQLSKIREKKTARRKVCAGCHGQCPKHNSL